MDKEEMDYENENPVKKAKKSDNVKSVEPKADETKAAQSVEPKGSKAEVMKVAMSMIAGMTPEDLNGFQKMMAQYGPNADLGIPDDAAAKNAASIKAKPSFASVKEDVEDMFKGQELSEEFKERATTLFEAAVSARVSVESARIEEEYQNMLKEELNLFAEEVTDKLDTYLDYVVENWMTENEVAIESTLRNEIAEEFIDDLKGLFEKNYMNVPEEKVDVIESLSEKVNDLENSLHQTISENKDLKNALVEQYKEKMIENVTSDLTMSQKERFLTFAEGISFDGNFDTYVNKLEIIKENYFVSDVAVSSNIEEETYEGEVLQENTSYVDPMIERYARALQRTVKK